MGRKTEKKEKKMHLYYFVKQLFHCALVIKETKLTKSNTGTMLRHQNFGATSFGMT